MSEDNKREEGVNYWQLPAKDQSDNAQIFLTTLKLDSKDHIEFVKSPKTGAVCYFGGTTRDSFGSKEVTLLEYEASHQLALRSLRKIVNEAFTKFGDQVYKISIAHRLGLVPVLEESISIAVSCCHRKESFECCEFLLERIKESVEIWKKENYKDGTSNWKENDNSNVLFKKEDNK